MSHISFASDQGRVEIGGRERARMGILIDSLAWVMHSRGRAPTDPMKEHYERLQWIYGAHSLGPQAEDEFGIRLGWVCLIGNDITRLIAHIHGQCEIHGWVHPDDTEWFAGLIEQAVDAGLLGDDGRGSYGSWADVADLARQSTTPLVSAYSVTESWPDPYLIARTRPDLFSYNEETEDSWDVWERLGERSRRQIANKAIFSCAPRWRPAEWGIWANLVHGRTPWVLTNDVSESPR